MVEQNKRGRRENVRKGETSSNRKDEQRQDFDENGAERRHVRGVAESSSE